MEREWKQLQALGLHHWKERALRFPLMPITQFLVFACGNVPFLRAGHIYIYLSVYSFPMLLDRRWNGQEGYIPTDHVKDAEPLKAVMKVKRKEMVPLVMVRMKRVEKIAVTVYNA